VVGYAMAEIGGTGTWRWMLASGGVLSALILLLRIGTPEPPLWLVNEGRTADAQKAIKQALDRTVPTEDLLASAADEESVEQSRFRDLFQGAYLRRTLFCWLFCMGMSSRAYTKGGVLVPSEHHIGAFHTWLQGKLDARPVD
jgi:MFS transporter, putative metabolite transport protein